MLEDDFTRWTYWWEYNKGSYLLRQPLTGSAPQTGSDDFFLGAGRARHDARDTLEPTAEDALQLVLPALKAAIDESTNRDIVTASMIAMAKIGRNHPDFELLDVFAPRLSRSDQEVRETAALAIGIAAIDGPRELDLLLTLARDEEPGRRACRSSHVADRTRAFAAYGLGLLAHGSQQLKTRFRVVRALTALIDDERTGRDLLVAAIHGLGLLQLDPRNAGEQALLVSALGSLERCYLARRGPGDQLLQAHCPTAIARLIDRDHPQAGHYRELFAQTLSGRERPARSGRDLARSCALALGRLCRPGDEDQPYRQVLFDAYGRHRDQQTRSFAILALGLAGGADARERLLRSFDRANKTQEKPWVALALGVLEHGRRSRAGDAAATEPDRLIAETLLDAFVASKTPDLTGALAVALGLARVEDALAPLQRAVMQSLGQAETAGYLCIGIGLLRGKESAATLREVLQLSLRRPDLLRQAALASSHLDDRQAALALHQMLEEDDANLARLAAIAQALGLIGDRRSIAPLTKVLASREMTLLSRAFAAAALGGVADKEEAPWNSKIAEGINYRAVVETLTNSSTGILDIL